MSSNQSTIIIKKSKVKKAGGGGVVVVADKLFAAVLLLPEELERLVYSYLPTPERMRKEIILNRYGLLTFKQMQDADDYETFKYTIEQYRDISKNVRWNIREWGYNRVVLQLGISRKNIFLGSLDYMQWISKDNNIADRDDMVEKIQLELRHQTQRLGQDADFDTLKFSVLICKYYLECKKRNDGYRRHYRSIYDSMLPDADGLTPKKWKCRSQDRVIATAKNNTFNRTDWVNRELSRDRKFADGECYTCEARWLTKTRSKQIEPLIMKSGTTSNTITVKPDCRQCEQCQHAEIKSRVAITMYSF